MDICERAFYNKKMYKEKHYEFKKLFNFDLKNYLGKDLVQRITGFDIVKFDEDIQTPSGISTKTFILQKYGQEAQTLIQCLIDN